jgi:outer membrane lipoprotein SlyB
MLPLRTAVAALVALLLLDGCVSQPMGPTVAVMPAPNKPFEVFQQDQALCRQYADQQVAGGAQQANNQQVLTGVAGTVLGAGLGAAVGGGRGAAVGAASGAVAGTVVGAGPAQQAQMSLQQRYDMAYAQCMYARGNQVPGFAPGYAPPPPPPSR